MVASPGHSPYAGCCHESDGHKYQRSSGCWRVHYNEQRPRSSLGARIQRFFSGKVIRIGLGVVISGLALRYIVGFFTG